MINNELEQIQAQKRRFAMLRKRIIGQSSKEIMAKLMEYREKEEEVKRIERENTPESLNGHYLYKKWKCELDVTPSIRENALEALEWAGFNKDDAGTQYIATLATIFFHERELYRREDTDKSYWDLSDCDNVHYGMLGLPKQKVIADILTVMDKNAYASRSHETLIYNLADDLEYYCSDHDAEKRKPYTDMLKEKPPQKNKI